MRIDWQHVDGALLQAKQALQRAIDVSEVNLEQNIAKSRAEIDEAKSCIEQAVAWLQQMENQKP